MVSLNSFSLQSNNVYLSRKYIYGRATAYRYFPYCVILVEIRIYSTYIYVCKHINIFLCIYAQ
jgi:hypothetical protein